MINSDWKQDLQDIGTILWGILICGAFYYACEGCTPREATAAPIDMPTHGIIPTDGPRHRVCSPMVVGGVGYLPLSIRSAFAQAAGYWSERLGERNPFTWAVRGVSVVYIDVGVYYADEPPTDGDETVMRVVGLVKDPTNGCVTAASILIQRLNWTAYDANMVSTWAAHELGHVLGLAHPVCPERGWKWGRDKQGRWGWLMQVRGRAAEAWNRGADWKPNACGTTLMNSHFGGTVGSYGGKRVTFPVEPHARQLQWVREHTMKGAND